MPAGRAVEDFLATKFIALNARARRPTSFTPRQVGLRPQDVPYSPSPAHFAAANRRLASIDRAILARVGAISKHWPLASPGQNMTRMAMLEREVDRARRTFGLLFEVFSQRGSEFAPALAAHDTIAVDCYAAVRAALPEAFNQPLLKPVTYMEHGYSPATHRRGVALARLLGDTNPFPLIRIPWDRDNPWQSVFLHEVAHNLQADMGLWQENQTALGNRLRSMGFDPLVVAIYRRWHKEIFADLAALLLGGTAAAFGMMEFLAHPGGRALTYRPGGAHPTGYLRVLILVEMMRRMGFPAEAARARAVWRGLYDPSRGHRIPAAMLAASARVVPAVVDEIAFQPRRGLGQHALADAIPFTRADEAAIRRAGVRIASGSAPAGLAPRHLVSAGRVALESGGDPARISAQVIAHLAAIHAAGRHRALLPAAQAA